MDDRHLRSILLNVQHRLSDNDQERLYFYLNEDVPRHITDISTLVGTLRLMQSFFDEEKISNNDFTLLIDAFQQIQCFDAVNLVKEHQRRVLLSDLNQSTPSLASTVPSVIEEFINDSDDAKKVSTDSLVPKQINCSSKENTNNKIIDKNNININPVSINEDTQRISFPQKQRLNKSLFTNKCFLLSLILFILTLGIIIAVSIKGISHINTLEKKVIVKRNLILEVENQNTRKGKQFKELLAKKDSTIEELNKTLIELKKERKTILMKAGRKFGGDGGGDFDDSLLPSFTSFHYIAGIILSDIHSFRSCQFIYLSLNNNQSRIKSKIHGGNGDKINSTYKYHLKKNERIKRVQVRSFNQDLLLMSGDKTWPFTTKLIKGLQFVTTKGRRIPPGIDLTGDDVESESFPGYTLGYVTGKSGLYIDQLQFFWYRTL